MQTIAISLIKLYQKLIRPFLAPSCRFEPCCSEYSLAALNKYGFFKGIFLTAKRLLKCHPFHSGGFDPLK